MRMGAQTCSSIRIWGEEVSGVTERNDQDHVKQEDQRTPLVEVHGDAYDNVIVDGDINAPFTITNRR